ncbi:MAG: histidine phosphatase family protein [Hydrogenophaga sp.]|uniref:histidine phosphatase family protein n=1 Tax=Hydrogenophaga sp. TaxID=1904254 RepID=UPI0027311430|nr:histidine phosphatase family protein [Hydrogenophaga sp.]MDP2406462.1 histidine phosphatase family protein [Hydrogenophaga sp.]MDZ4176326.1 histidine phosphatase family protein [Hydrogenophaga sp.]
MALTLLMARHGQTDLNTDERWQGRIDMPLNAAGLAQAEQLALALPGGIDVLVVSPMLRARQTAEPVALARGLVPRFDADFRERDFGIFEGLTADEAAQQFPELAARNVAYRWDQEPPEAESTRAVVDRVARGLAQLRVMHGGQTVLLVSHGFVVRCLRYLIDGLSDDAFFAADRIPNGSFLTRQLP